MQLSLEQEFNISSFAEKVKTMGETEVKALLVTLYEQMIHSHNNYNQELKKAWFNSTDLK